MTIVKSSNATAATKVGDTITYSFLVTNSGNVTITSFVVTDPHVGLSAINCGAPVSLAPGATHTCTATYVVTQADVDAGEIRNQATVNGQTGSGPVTDDDILMTPLTRNPALTVVKGGVLDMTVVAPTGRADAGDRIVYTLTATNSGNTTLTGVTVTDTKAGALSCTPTQPATLLPGEHITCTGSYTLTQADIDAGTVHNVATADSVETAPVNAPKDVAITRVPALTLVKQDALDMTVVAPTTRADVGDKINYTLTATNAGNVTLTGVTIIDTKLGTLVCTPLQPVTLGPGQKLTCTGSYTLTQADLDAGTVHNVATGDSNETTPVDTPKDTAITKEPELTLVKQGTVDPTVVAPADRADVGDRITYTLTASNSGNVTLTGVTVSDPKIGSLVCTPPQPATLAPGAHMTCTGTHTLTQADIDAGHVDNTGTAGSDETTPTDTPNRVPVTQEPDLTLVKQGAVDMTVVAPTDRVDAGDRIVYTLTATNVGNVTLTGVTVSDPKLGLLSCLPPQPATLAPGAQMVCTGAYTLTQADVNNGQVVNTATGDSAQTPPKDATATTPLPAAPALTLAKVGTIDMTVVAPANRADAGDKVNYTLTATNAGNVTLTGVTIVRSEAGDARVRAAAAGDARARREDRLHRELHADAGRREQRPGHEHRDGRQRPDTAHGDDRADTGAAGAGAHARQGRDGGHDRGRPDRPRRRGRQGRLHADGDERGQRDADQRDDRRSRSGSRSCATRPSRRRWRRARSWSARAATR